MKLLGLDWVADTWTDCLHADKYPYLRIAASDVLRARGVKGPRVPDIYTGVPVGHGRRKREFLEEIYSKLINE